MDRLTRFLVDHEGCQPGPQVADPTEADLTPSGNYWTTIHCPGCGATIREERDFEATFRDLARYAGMTMEALLDMASSDDGMAEIAKRVEERGLHVPEVLIQIMKARGEQQNN